MNELEMKVEALVRCVPQEIWQKALAEVSKARHAVPERRTDGDMERAIRMTLVDIGVPAHVKGHRYLVSALLAVTRNERLLDAVTKDLYPMIAREYDTRPSCVERAIRHAIELAWGRGDLEVLESYFGNTVSAQKGKPTNSEFMARLSEILRHRLLDAKGNIYS